MNITRVGVDIAKSVFHVHGVDRHDQVQWRGKYSRGKWLDAIAKRVPEGAEIGMEACASSHHWARELQARGYRVKLIAAQFVKPYVKSNKNDRVDAEAICEAMGRPNMRFVAVKTVEQQDVQAVHRIRSELVQQRTAKANQIRGLIGEYGLVAPTGIGQLRAALPRWLEDAENGLTDDFRVLLAGLAEDLRHLGEVGAVVVTGGRGEYRGVASFQQVMEHIRQVQEQAAALSERVDGEADASSTVVANTSSTTDFDAQADEGEQR